MKLNDMFPSKYLKKEDVEVPRVATIAGLSQDKVKGDNGMESKWIISFQGDVKPLILNKGNAITISDMYGDDPAAWVGRQIELYCDPSVMMAGKRVGGTRIRRPLTNGNHSQQTAWTIEQAIQNAAAAGITKDMLRAKLAEKGLTGWNMLRDTPWLEVWIKEVSPNQDADVPLDAPPPQGAEIPF